MENKIYHTIRTVLYNNNFLKIGDLWSENLVITATFYWSAFTKSGEWAVIYMCVRCIGLSCFYGFSIWFLNCSESMVFPVFHLIMQAIRNISAKQISLHGREFISDIISYVCFYCNICIGVLWLSCSDLLVYLLPESSKLSGFPIVCFWACLIKKSLKTPKR